MSEDAIITIVLIFAFLGLPALGGAVWGIYAMIQDTLEKRHKRKLEIIKAETKLHQEIERQWNDQFRGNIK